MAKVLVGSRLVLAGFPSAISTFAPGGYDYDEAIKTKLCSRAASHLIFTL